MSEQALKVADRLTKEWEGFKLQAYPDPATGGAPWTIGYGSTGPDINKDTVWTKAQADARHTADLAKFMKGVESSLTRKPTANQLGAMTSLAYNIGLGNFRKSTLLKKFNAGDIYGAADQFQVWRKANGKVMQGLINRRADERRVFES